jgi:hypothetical protein
LLNRIALAAIATLVLAVAATTAQADARKAARQAGEISFYLDINQPINSPSIKNPLVVRPATIYLFEDGSWVIKDLQWSGWGTSVASASGTSSASDCKPDCASGQRKETPAQLMLSSPGLVLGHQVYRCYRLVVPAPATNLHGCLGRIGSLIGYTPAAKPNLSAPKLKLVRFYTPSHNIECEMNDNGGAQSSVFCDMVKPGAIVSVFANGHVNIQRGGSGNFGEGPAARLLPYGSSVVVGRFRCTSAFAGVTCVVAKTGKGFFLSKKSIRAVG